MDLRPDYRYELTRSLTIPRAPAPHGTILWVMLNPSTATEKVDDPTIRRCISFSRRWGFQRMHVGNLFAVKATDPRALLDMDPDERTGRRNDAVLERLAAGADYLLAAWGAWGSRFPERTAAVLRIMTRHRDVHCLALTADSQPKHPVRLRSSTERQLYRRLAAP